VYLDVKIFNPGNDHGVGKIVSLYTNGWLLYTLHWKFKVTESCQPFGYTLEAWEDLERMGIWTFDQAGLLVNIRYDWKISLIRYSFVHYPFYLDPFFFSQSLLGDEAW
jgi:hypothetical protein